MNVFVLIMPHSVVHANARQSLKYCNSVHVQLHTITAQRPPAVPVSTQASSLHQMPVALGKDQVREDPGGPCVDA